MQIRSTYSNLDDSNPQQDSCIVSNEDSRSQQSSSMREPKVIVVTDKHSKKTRVLIFQSYSEKVCKNQERLQSQCPASLFYNLLILLFQNSPKCFEIESECYQKPYLIDPLTNQRVSFNQIRHRYYYIVDFEDKQNINQESYENMTINNSYNNSSHMTSQASQNTTKDLRILSQYTQNKDIKSQRQIEDHLIERNKDIRAAIQSSYPRYIQVEKYEQFIANHISQSQEFTDKQFSIYEQVIMQQWQDLKNNLRVYQNQLYSASEDLINRNAFIQNKLNFISGIDMEFQNILEEFKQAEEQIQDLERYQEDEQETCLQSLLEGKDSFVPSSIIDEFQDYLKNEQILKNQIKSRKDQLEHQHIQTRAHLLIEKPEQINFRILSPNRNTSESHETHINLGLQVDSTSQLDNGSLDSSQVKEFLGIDSVQSSLQSMQSQIGEYKQAVDTSIIHDGVRQSFSYRFTDFLQNRPSNNLNPISSFLFRDKLRQIQSRTNTVDSPNQRINDRMPFDFKTTKGNENIKESIEIEIAQDEKNTKLKDFEQRQFSPRGLIHQQKQQMGVERIKVAESFEQKMQYLIDQKETLFLVHNNFEKRQLYIQILDLEGNMNLRYLPGNNVIRENLRNLVKLNYGDFQEKGFADQFCKRDGRKNLILSLSFQGVEVPMFLECLNSKQLIDWYKALKVVVQEKFNKHAIILKENLFLIRLNKLQVI
ncbi:UNKNOWN [Stylonychia lemnae]|uniref:Uncharacterized protein n=1 Tax=Stylonychia lemnae TaxID=5949 RepID=A0A078AW44_STYLE|nr:UNKNOWN [Stylonychia lemnae]|eukprot:CDW85008.1 UNKNOWN [Stylonychia lemnae]